MVYHYQTFSKSVLHVSMSKGLSVAGEGGIIYLYLTFSHYFAALEKLRVTNVKTIFLKPNSLWDCISFSYALRGLFVYFAFFIFISNTFHTYNRQKQVTSSYQFFEESRMKKMLSSSHDGVFVLELPQQHFRKAFDQNGQCGVGARSRRGCIRGWRFGWRHHHLTFKTMFT